ncbi:MAG: hypothetical protein ABIO88_01480 [Burkholderiaceae bacterium]
MSENLSPHAHHLPVDHLLIPFAAVSSEAAAPHLQNLKLPNLRLLLNTLTLVGSDVGADESFSPPHERALARAQGLLTQETLVDGYIPWAAQEAAKLGLQDINQEANSAVWGWVSLCNYFVGTGSMTLEDPAQLHVTEAESRQLLADMGPYFVEDGIHLYYVEPNRWLARGAPLQSIPTASLDRVVGRNLDAWQPEGQAAAKLRRLQNEMQMLLYTHTVNDARNRSKTAPINSIWLHGTGELTALQPKVSTNINTPRSLADAALREDWAAWAQAWEQLDATACADLLKRVQAGEAVTLTLCGERSALTYELRPKSGLERLKSNFRGFLGLQLAYLLPKQL